MATPFERFTQGVTRLTAQAAELRNARSQNEQQILRLQTRQGELDGLLADIEGQTLTLAHNYTEVISHPTPDRMTPGDAKPIIVIDDEDANITLTPRSGQPRPISPPRQAPPPQPVLQPLQHQIIHPKYPTVVFLDGVWTEIWCGACGANSRSQGRNFFFSGVGGLLRHWAKTHKKDDPTPGASLASCGRRVLGDKEVSRMKAGESAGLTIRNAKGEPKRASLTSSGRRVSGNEKVSRMTAVELGELSVRNLEGEPQRTVSASILAVSDSASADLGSRPSFTGHARLSGVALKPVSAMTAPLGHLPPMGTFGTTKTSAATINRLTEYEMFRNLEAEARAAGTPEAKKKRASTGRPKYSSGDMDYTDDEIDEDEQQHVRKRVG